MTLFSFTPSLYADRRDGRDGGGAGGGVGGGEQGGVEWNVTDLKRHEGRVSFKL